MNKRQSCLNPELIQFAVIGSFSLKKLIFAVEGNLIENLLHAHSILFVANQKSNWACIFQPVGNSLGQEDLFITYFEYPKVLTVFCI